MSKDIQESAGRSLFGGDAKSYASVRPGYPASFLDSLVQQDLLKEGLRILDVGAGSGLASRQLMDRGSRDITILEPDHRFAGVLESEFGDEARLVFDSFENAQFEANSFDLILCATAFHWLDPETRVSRFVDALKPPGYVCLMWNLFGDPDKEDPFHDATTHLLAGLDDSPSGRHGETPFALRKHDRVAEFEENGFRLVTYLEEKWPFDLDASGVRDLYSTFSPIQMMEEDDRVGLIDQLEDVASKEFSDQVTRNMTSVMYLFQLR